MLYTCRRNLVDGLVASLDLEPIPAKKILNSITNSLKAPLIVPT